MSLSSRLSASFLALALGVVPWSSARAADSATVPEEGDFIRYLEADSDRQELQTAVVRYVKGKRIVDLVGVVHLADPGYYDALNVQLGQYDVVLYEMVGGEFETRDLRGADALPEVAGVGSAQSLITRMLGMEYQTDGIDYSPKHFVHADVDWVEYQELMTARSQSLMTLFQRAMDSANSEDAPAILTDEAAANQMLTSLVAGFTTGNTAELKRSMAPLLGEAEALINQIEGEDGTVIVTERNRVVMRVLNRELKKRANQNLAIFYGAGHLPDLEKRLLDSGFKRETGVWMTAWDIQDPEPGETGQNLWQTLFSDPEVMEGLMSGLQEAMRQLNEGGQLGQ